MNNQNYPPLPRGTVEVSFNGHRCEPAYTSDQVRAVQKQRVRECWRHLIKLSKDPREGDDCQSAFLGAAQDFSERFGPFDE